MTRALHAGQTVLPSVSAAVILLIDKTGDKVTFRPALVKSSRAFSARLFGTALPIRADGPLCKARASASTLAASIPNSLMALSLTRSIDEPAAN